MSARKAKMPDRVLKFVNRVRVEKMGLKPLKQLPRGMRGNTRSCPVALALRGARVGGGETIVLRDETVVKAPKYLQADIAKFDLGGYPGQAK